MPHEAAVLGGGCFWCTESIFKELKGVIGVMPGYAGGEKPDPTYEQVCGGGTGHAEVIRVEFDPAEISFKDILQVFFATHDPTTLNRQGNDVGTQYRSIILYDGMRQKEDAEAVIAELKAAGGYGGREVVTEVAPLTKFWEAESYHRDYYAKNRGENPYCQLVIDPKLKKFRERFHSLLKPS
jgi:peptide-methionine (S)-S-oxide reductase